MFPSEVRTVSPDSGLSVDGVDTPGSGAGRRCKVPGDSVSLPKSTLFPPKVPVPVRGDPSGSTPTSVRRGRSRFRRTLQFNPHHQTPTTSGLVLSIPPPSSPRVRSDVVAPRPQCTSIGWNFVEEEALTVPALPQRSEESSHDSCKPSYARTLITGSERG